jgi:hypothetical protein
MALRGRVVLVVLWIASVMLVAAISSSAQSRQVRPEAAPVISGADIGFRPEGWQGKARTGTFVVRINGEWVEAIPGASVRPAMTR